MASCVIDFGEGGELGVEKLSVSGFWADTTTYYLQSQNKDETHFLCAFLNSKHVNEAIKPYQTRGAWGERDIHRRPFEVVPIPKFDAKDKKHLKLAELSQECHRKVAQLNLEGKSIGLLRNKVREILMAELDEIDQLVKSMLS